MIEFVDVSYTYPGASRPAVAHVSITVRPGEVTALLGANGSGKSTVARMANGILVPVTGRVTVDDLCAHEEATVWDVRTRVGMVFQDPDDQIVGTAVEEDVAFGPENLGVEREAIQDLVARSLEAVGLTGFERREPHLLSGGQKQRLAIAGALALDPSYLVLDEVKTMLDPEGRRDVDGIVTALKRDGRGILLITHDLDDLALADRVVVMSRGRAVFAGTPAELPQDVAALAAWELAPTPMGALVAELGRLGAELSSSSAPEEVAAALWPSNS